MSVQQGVTTRSITKTTVCVCVCVCVCLWPRQRGMIGLTHRVTGMMATWNQPLKLAPLLLKEPI